MMDVYLSYFTNILGNWQILSLLMIGVLLIYRIFFRDYYEKMWSWVPWKIHWILLAVAGIIAIQIREIIMFPFVWISVAFPGYSLADQLFFYLGNIHVRSIMFWAIMIFYLWHKMGHLLPAVYTGWFFVGLAELTFIPQHLIWQNGLFLGFEHYLPFMLIMVPFLLEMGEIKKFKIPRLTWIWFSGGIFMQYFGLLFTPWAVVQLREGGWGFVINGLAQPNPHLFTYFFDLSQHLIKTFFTVGGAYVNLKHRTLFYNKIPVKHK